MPGPEMQAPWQMLNVLGVILGGGRGSRLYPLTRDRAKPAVPLLGQYRLIDIPISNCLNSGISRMYVLTQFNSESLLRHIANTYKFDVFTDGWVEILPAQQTYTDDDWYQGPADAVRQNLHFIADQNMPHVLILSGDQLYRMDYRRLVATHRRNAADATISCLPVSEENVGDLGILRQEDDGSVMDFAEKPAAGELGPEFRMSDQADESNDNGPNKRPYLASMGIYLFNTEALIDVLESNPNCDDFGAGIIPKCLDCMNVHAHCFDGYWEDIGTIESFYRANLYMTHPSPVFDFYVEQSPVYTHPRFLPPPRVSDCRITHSLIGGGSRIEAESIDESVVGLRARIGAGTQVKRSIIMGQDFYESDGQDQANANLDRPSVGIGENCILEECIIDKNVRLGPGVTIRSKNRHHLDTETYSVRDGLVVIPKNTTVPPGAEI